MYSIGDITIGSVWLSYDEQTLIEIKDTVYDDRDKLVLVLYKVLKDYSTESNKPNHPNRWCNHKELFEGFTKQGK